MKINIENNITAELLLQGVKFHRETNKDIEACNRIKELEGLLVNIIGYLGYLRYETTTEFKNASGKDIREKIDNLIKSVENEIYEIKEEAEFEARDIAAMELQGDIDEYTISVQEDE